MKKIKSSIVCTIILTIALLFNSCGSSLITIEHRTWEFSHIQNEEGAVVYRSEAAEKQHLFDEAEVIDLSCSIGKNMMTLATDARSWNISYTIDGDSNGSTMYDLSYNGSDGYAIVSKTVRDNGNNEYTMIVVLGGYTVYFTAPIN